MAPATVGNHLAHLSGFFTWVAAHAPGLLPHGDLTKKADPPPIPAPEPRALSEAKVRTLKNTVDRIETFHHLTGRRHRGDGAPTLHRHARPLRDRAIVFTILGTGLRRAEIVNLDLAQVEPSDPKRLRAARSAKLTGVRGKGRTTRTVFLGQDARTALADYLETERPADADEHSEALFLAAISIGARRPGGRLSTRTINTIVGEIGRLHDAQFDEADADRRLGGLTPHTGVTRSPTGSRRSPGTNSPNSNAASATPTSDTSSSTPTRRKPKPPDLSKTSDPRPRNSMGRVTQSAAILRAADSGLAMIV
jgi:site-specific recombinase XerD